MVGENQRRTGWEQLKFYGLGAGKKVLTLVLMLGHAWCDSDTPVWAKSVIAGAIAYFLWPVDAVPDGLPVVGYSDDWGALLQAAALVALHIKPVHRAKAEVQAQAWLGEP